MMLCSFCNGPKVNFKCGGCKATAYCNESCQRSDWKSHKAKCKELIQEEKQRKASLGNTLFRYCSDGIGASVTETLKLGADVNFVVRDGPSRGSFPLLVACKQGNLDVIRILLKAGASLNAVGEETVEGTRESYSSLGVASALGHESVVRELLATGAVDVNKSFGALLNSSVYLAANAGHHRVVRALVECGVNVNQRRKTGESPLHPAACTSHVECVQVLVAAGANVHHKDPYTGGTILHLSIGYHQKQSLPNAQDKILAVVTILLDAGVDASAKDYFGNTALDRAVQHKFPAVAALLRDHAATAAGRK